MSPPLLTDACLASHSTIDHHSPTGHTGGGGGVGVTEEEMWLDGSLELPEITADLLQQVENTTRIS